MTPLIVARQAPLSMEFSRQEYWSGLPCPPLGDLPNPGLNLGPLHCRQILDCVSHQGNQWIHIIDIIPVISGIALLWALHMNIHCSMHVTVTSLAKCLLETGPMLVGHRESSQYIHIGRLTER